MLASNIHHDQITTCVLCGPSLPSSHISAIVDHYSIIDSDTVFISPGNYAQFFKSKNYIADEELASGFDSVKEVIRIQQLMLDKYGLHRSKNWYRQQFIKIALALKFSHTLLVDGDTFISPHTISMVSQGILYRTRENPSLYLFSNHLRNVSFISNFGLILRESLVNTFRETAAVELFTKLLKKCLHVNCDFSEYQLFAYMSNKYSSNIGTTNLKMYRRGDLLITSDAAPMAYQRLMNKLKYYDAVSYEYQHARTCRSRVMARIALKLKYSW